MIDGFTEGFLCGVTFPSFRDLSDPLVIHKMSDTEHIIGQSPSTRARHLSWEYTWKFWTKENNGYGLFLKIFMCLTT